MSGWLLLCVSLAAAGRALGHASSSSAALNQPRAATTTASGSGSSNDVEVHYHAFTCPVANDDELELTLVLPSASDSATTTSSTSNGTATSGATPSAAPPNYGGLPVVVFVPGFLLRSCMYLDYADALARAGYATLLIDDVKAPLSDVLPLYSDAARVEWIDKALGCLTLRERFSSRLDLNSVSVAGHSRGGKIAGLYYAANWLHTRAAFLVDPIDTPVHDGDKCLPFLPSYDGPNGSTPNLAEALFPGKPYGQGPNRLGLLGTAETSVCNCNSSNFRELWGADGAMLEFDNWLVVLQKAGHLQVADDTLSRCGSEHWLNQQALRATVAYSPCARGPQTSGAAVATAARVMVEFFNEHVKDKRRSHDFAVWLQQRIADGTLTYATPPPTARR